MRKEFRIDLMQMFIQGYGTRPETPEERREREEQMKKYQDDFNRQLEADFEASRKRRKQRLLEE